MLSRVADSLYWMSRYIERAENNARIAEVNLQMLLDLTNQQEPDPKQQWDPIISSLEENELFASLYPTPDGKAVIDFVSLQKKNPNSIMSCLTRVALREGSLVVNSSQGGGSKDTWVLSDAGH